MAAGFKQATVNSARVPSTQSNFPVYVDLSRLGITTLAEAESVRVYADSAKTTEWAREIVSATEMHVKVPSMTSTTSMYVDYDGVRADYAAGDTYGRNAVWSGYRQVMHLQANSNDSTGNGLNGTDTNVSYGTGGKIASRADIVPTTNSRINISGLNLPTSTNPKSFTFWCNLDVLKRQWFVAGGTESANQAFGLFMNGTSGSDNLVFFGNGGGNDIDYGTGQLSTATWTKISITYDGTNVRYYKNGSLVNTTARTLNTTNTSSGTLVGNRKTDESNSRYDGKMDEVRFMNGTWSNDWETTEYNNQNDEADFWGTWSNVATAKRGAILSFF